MAEIREIFETVKTYCGMMFLDAKMPRGEKDKSVSEAAKQLGSGAAKRNCYLEKRQSPSVVIPSVSEGIQSINNRHSEGNNNLIPKNLVTGNTEKLTVYPSKSSLTEGRLMLQEVAHDNNFDSPETVYSLLTTHHSLKKAAFTLAEVLITLGIIGVVAALTLPTLIQNHQKQVYVTQLKKAYSNLSNAYNQIANDEGVTEWSQTCLTDWTENNNCLHKLAKQMKAINTKDFDVTCSADWCKYGYDLDDGIDISTSWSIFNPATGMFTTPDGVLYMFACGSFSTILVDVNGINKSPNKPGRDIFEFGRKVTSDYDANGHWIGYTDYNSLEPSGAYSWDPDAWKNCSATNLSTSCTAKVLIEGKMNY